jgi:hypothetical protein
MLVNRQLMLFSLAVFMCASPSYSLIYSSHATFMTLGGPEPERIVSWAPLNRRAALEASFGILGALGMPSVSRAADADLGSAVRVSVVRGAQLADSLDEKVSLLDEPPDVTCRS